MIANSHIISPPNHSLDGFDTKVVCHIYLDITTSKLYKKERNGTRIEIGNLIGLQKTQKDLAKLDGLKVQIELIKSFP